MGEASAIEWTDHTFNPIIGCTKVSPACKHCYAEHDFDHRFGKAKWGDGGTRVLTSDANWRKPLAWNREAEKTGIRQRVFCASLSDVFEGWGQHKAGHQLILNSKGHVLWINHANGEIAVPGEFKPFDAANAKLRYLTLDDVRRRLFNLIDATPMLDWLLLTKRPENIRRMWPVATTNLSVMHATGRGELYRENVWLGTSVENQKYANERIPELLNCGDIAPVLFLSCEPLLGPVDLRNIQVPCVYKGYGPDAHADNLIDSLTGEVFSGEDGSAIGNIANPIRWVIAGGESGPNARPSNPDWFHSLLDQCKSANVPFMFKQWGEWAPCTLETASPAFMRADTHAFDEECNVFRVGRKVSGRLLGGVLHHEFPEVPS